MECNLPNLMRITSQTFQYTIQPRSLERNPILEKMRCSLERETKQSYNSVLVNLYEDENDHVPFHSDDEIIFGVNPVIASVSFGETRRFQLRRKGGRGSRSADFEISLRHGSLLTMSGKTQKNWQHAIPKDATKRSERINLTFRNIVQLH